MSATLHTLGLLLLLVIDEVQSLTAVERETGITGDQRHVERHGVRDDDVVAGVLMVLRRVDAQMRVGIS